MLRKIRIVLAAVMFVGITLLFLDFSGTLQPWLGWMAKLQFLPAVLAMNVVSVLVVVALTLLLGRLYCSVICPLGVMQDVFAWIGRLPLFRKNKKSKNANKYSYSKPKTWLRIPVLVWFVIMLATGVTSLSMLIAPYSAYGRIVTATLQPIYIMVNNLLASIAEQSDSYMFYKVEPHAVPLMLAIVAGVSAVVLLVLAFMNGRTYCNTICPVGTVLGYLSRFSWFKMRVDESKCSKCGLCMKNCKASCIEISKGGAAKIDYTRCVMCGNCEAVCAKGAMTLKSKGANKKAEGANQQAEESRQDATVASQQAEANAQGAKDAGKEGDSSMSRRAFLGVIGVAAAASVSAEEKKTDGGFAAIEDKQIPNRKTPLTPPGSISARNLQQHCTSCQLCIANCPNKVLRPGTSLDNMLQPVMEYENGFCRPECTRCSEVCPTGAIRTIAPEEKVALQIGRAVWVKKNCLPVTDGVTCGNCASKCPSGAIQMVPLDKTITQDEEGKWVDAEGNRVKEREMLSIPVIDTEVCIGCGACEYLCPARPFSAIYVEGNEVHHDI